MSTSSATAQAASFATVLQEALRRLCADRAPALPAWIDAPKDDREGRRIGDWVRKSADLALVDAGTILQTALGTSAHLLLVALPDGWYLIDCREGAALLWSGSGDGSAHLSSLDLNGIRNILSLRPAQDISPKVATDRAAQPLLLPFLREYRGRLVELIAASLVINLVALMLPLFTSIVYDKVVGNGITETLWALAIGLLLFLGLDLVLKMMRSHTVETVASRTDARAERLLLERLLAQRGPMPPVGLMLARYRDLVSAREFLSSSWLLALADTPFVLVYLITVALIGGPVVIVPLVVSVLMIAAHLLLHKPSTRYSEIAVQAQTRKVTVLSEVLGAGEVVRSTHLRYALGRRFGQLSEAGALAQARSRFWLGLSHHISGTAVTLGSVGILCVGVFQIEARELSVGGLVACSMLGARAVALLSGLTTLGSRWKELRSATRKLQDLLADSQNEAERPLIDPSAAQWQARSNSLALRSVSYAHDPKRPLIEKLSLDVPPGQFVVLLGKPGAGKSTLLKLLGGLLRPAEGDVIFDGHSLADWPAEIRARRLSIKPQEAILFEGTLAENIVAGAEAQVTEASFATALRLSGLDQWIKNGELSLSQRLLPGGTNLSGGQRQVVALARSLATDPPVLLLDEPTVGLDHQTEQAIVARLREWARGRTVVVATHSMALVGVADRLVVLEGGRVLTDGPRDKVLAQPPARPFDRRAEPPRQAGSGDVAGPAPVSKASPGSASAGLASLQAATPEAPPEAAERKPAALPSDSAPVL